MTIDQFLESLETWRHGVGQWSSLGGYIRFEDDEGGPPCQCPIVYLANHTLNGEWRGQHYRHAGHTLGLDADSVRKIVLAADDHGSIALRAKLIKAVGLSAP